MSHLIQAIDIEGTKYCTKHGKLADESFFDLASAIIGQNNSSLLATAKEGGSAGNSLSVNVVIVPNSSDLTVTESDGQITVTSGDRHDLRLREGPHGVSFLDGSVFAVAISKPEVDSNTTKGVIGGEYGEIITIENFSGSIKPQFWNHYDGLPNPGEPILRPWSGMTISDNANNLFAVAPNFRIAVSNSQGGGWDEREEIRNWSDVAASSNGEKAVATVLGGYIYTSNDSGVTWTQRDNIRNWVAVASSSDGSKLVAIVEQGYIYTSNDSGVTWTQRDNIRNWSDVASSADGSKLVATVSIGYIYTSNDSGVTWTEQDDVRNWSQVASSADGSRIVAAVNSGGLFMSINSGETWLRQVGGRFDFTGEGLIDGQFDPATAVTDFSYVSEWKDIALKGSTNGSFRLLAAAGSNGLIEGFLRPATASQVVASDQNALSVSLSIPSNRDGGSSLAAVPETFLSGGSDALPGIFKGWRTVSIFSGNIFLPAGEDEDVWVLGGDGNISGGQIKIATCCLWKATVRFFLGSDNAIYNGDVSVNGIIVDTFTRSGSAGEIVDIEVDLDALGLMSRPCGNIWNITVLYEDGTNAEMSVSIINVTLGPPNV